MSIFRPYQTAEDVISDDDTPRNGHSRNGSKKPPPAKLNLRDLRTVRFERVTWFEANMIPLAEFTLVNGDGGIGKTTFLLDLVARASARREMPSGLLHDRALRILIIAEEDRHGLLRARLDVAKANHDNIRLIESVGDEADYITFPTHSKALQQTIVEGDYNVVMIDALFNHLDDDVNASRPQEMRRALKPLVDVAHTTKATITAVRHIGKGAGPASVKGFGSAEARNVARSELTVAPHPDKDTHPGLHIVALSKSNLTPDSSATMAYRLLSTDVFDDDGLPTTIPIVEWAKTPPTVSADDLLDRQEPGDRSAISAASDWLRSFLVDGERRAVDVQQAAEKAGHSTRTLYRARDKAFVVSEPRGFPAQAYWRLKTTQDCQPCQVSTIGKPGNPGDPGTTVATSGMFADDDCTPNSDDETTNLDLEL